MARSAEDIALLLQVLAGADPEDPGAADMPVPDYRATLSGDLTGLRVGVPNNYFFDQIDPDINAAVHAGIDVLQGLGARIYAVDLPLAEYAYAVHWCLSYSEIYPHWRNRFIERRHDFGDIYLRKIATWAFLTGEEVVIGWRLREIVRKELCSLLENVDMLVTPATPIVPPRVDDFVGTHQDTSRLTRIANVAGLPALTVPCGFTPAGLPIGMQLMGRAWSEADLLRVAHAYAQVAGASVPRRPPLQPGPPHKTANSSQEIRDGNSALAVSPSASTVALWMRAYAESMGLTFLRADDFMPMAAQLAPIKSLLANARSRLPALSLCWPAG
jgi:aspartyl-tRNA(Asn)/glutamyl-tRNA(Gln) amidotransferase subunit A